MISVESLDPIEATPHPLPPRTKAWGLVVRKERWTLTLRAKLLATGAVAAAALILARELYPFLAVTKPVSHSILVMEGWMPAYMVEAVAHQFKARHYEHIVVARPLFKGRTALESGEFMANYIADRLVDLGIPRQRIHVVFSEASRKDRTFQSALSVRKGLPTTIGPVTALDVVTLGPHARRSRLMFERAFRNQLQVGVIGLDDPYFDNRHWWTSSAGVREMPFEFLAYLYAKLFVYPDDER